MSQQAPQLRQIRASAGSGKTYELTTSFLNHLADAAETGGDPFSGCRAVRSGPHGWPEILAVTFTNRAAAEMQERIIGRLKDTALGTGRSAPGWTREQARRWVGIILRRYGSLNVRTIDSLLHPSSGLPRWNWTCRRTSSPSSPRTKPSRPCWTPCSNGRGGTSACMPCWRTRAETSSFIPSSAASSPGTPCANG